MPFDARDFEQVKLLLKRAEILPDLADQELRLIADKTLEVARYMAPLDYGDLANAIQLQRVAERGANGRFVKGKSNYVIYVNNNHPVSDPEKQKHGVDTVGEYAWWVHEHMGWRSSPNPDFMPSNESERRGAMFGVESGGKFLERAGIVVGREINARLAQVVHKYIDILD